MSDNNSGIDDQSRPVRWKFQIEETILILLLILSVIGSWITDKTPADGYWYWMIMIFVFGLSAMIIGGIRAKQREHLLRDLLAVQTMHWGGSMLIVLATFSLLHAGRLDSENTGLVILLILALATFLDGIRVGWRFSMAGVFLGITAVLAGHMRHFIWAVILLAAFIVFITIAFQSWQRKRLDE
ncbi:MAG: hypothetical protein ABFS02_10045 [Pseudomonadota bacterium]